VSCTLAQDLICTLREARLALDEAPTIPLELYPIARATALLYRLDQHRRVLAQRHGGRDVDGGDAAGGAPPHILEWTVHDAIEDVAQLVARAQKRTLLPNQLLEVCGWIL
jgi:hypothetical protein